VKKRTILITGVCGCIGSHLLDELLLRGERVIGVDDLSYGKLDNVRNHLKNPNFRFIQLDVLDTGMLLRKVPHADVVLHQASLKKIGESQRAVPTLMVNAMGAESVLRFAKTRKSKVVISSTSDVYGVSEKLPFNEADDCVLGASTAIFRMLFWMKASYLLAEAGIVAILWRLFGKDARKAATIWLFSPIVLYGCYVFGQYRLWTALCLWAVIFCAEKGKNGRACALLGLTCLLDSFALLLLAPAVLVLGAGFKERAKLAACAAAPLVLILLPLAVHSRGYVLHAYYSPVVLQMATQSIFRTNAEIVAKASKIVLVGTWLACIAPFVFRNPVPPGRRADVFLRLSLAVLLTLHATSTTHVHYFMWTLPLFVWLMMKGEPWPRALSWIYFVLIFAFNLDTASAGPGLFYPFPQDVAWHVPGKAVAGSRLLYSVASLYFAAKILLGLLKRSDARAA